MYKHDDHIKKIRQTFLQFIDNTVEKKQNRSGNLVTNISEQIFWVVSTKHFTFPTWNKHWRYDSPDGIPQKDEYLHFATLHAKNLILSMIYYPSLENVVLNPKKPYPYVVMLKPDNDLLFQHMRTFDLHHHEGFPITSFTRQPQLDYHFDIYWSSTTLNAKVSLLLDPRGAEEFKTKLLWNNMMNTVMNIAMQYNDPRLEKIVTPFHGLFTDID